VYALWGMGCFDKDIRKRMGNVVYIQRCNRSLQDLAQDIGFRCWKEENRDDKFVRRIVREIKNSMRKSAVKSVYIVAHSYGGMVSSEAARKLYSDPCAYKLHIITFGSIDVVPPKVVPGIKLKQYMNRADVALRCNSSKTGIIWLDKKKASNMIDEWRSHMEYPLNETRDHIIKTLNSK